MSAFIFEVILRTEGRREKLRGKTADQERCVGTVVSQWLNVIYPWKKVGVGFGSLHGVKTWVCRGFFKCRLYQSVRSAGVE